MTNKINNKQLIMKNINDLGMIYFKSRKESDFNKLYEKVSIYFKDVVKIYTTDKVIQDDIVQESIINMYKYIHSYNNKYKFTTWISRILKNKAYELLKKEIHIDNLDDENIEFETIEYDNKKELLIKYTVNTFKGDLQIIGLNILNPVLYDYEYAKELGLSKYLYRLKKQYVLDKFKLLI